ncbi:MAG: glycosyltransferase family 39 protein [Phycisphaerae bacterium]|nr:glycosyltransferase family 39 protein [Phycisphaerae bacterium]
MPRRVTLFLVLVTAVLSALASATMPTDSIAGWMAHPGRVASLGGIPSTTIEGARALRLALAVGPLVLLTIALILARIERRAALVRSDATQGSRATVLTLSLLVGIAVILRSFKLSDSLWYDEIAGLLGYSVHGPGVIVGNYFSQANQVFSQLAIWLSTTLFGVNELTVRLPAFLAGVAAVPAAWALGREARGDGTGLFAAAAIALMPVAVLASCDARSYSFVILFATLATWLLLRSRRVLTLTSWAAFAIVVALMVWSHLASVCVALGYGLFLASDLLRGNDRRGALAGLVTLVGAATLTAMVYAPILPDMFALREHFRGHDAGQPTLLGPEGWHALLALGGSWTWWATIPGAALAIIGLAPTLREQRLREAFVLAALGAPIAVLLAWLGDSWLYARFLLFLVPATALLIAAGLATIARFGRLPLAVSVATLALASATDVLRLPPRQPLREAVERAAAIRATTHDQGPLGMIGLNDQVQLYYTQPLKLPVVDFGDRGAGLAKLLPSARPRMIVMLYPHAVSPERREFLRANGYHVTERLEGWIDWGHGAIEIWSR